MQFSPQLTDKRVIWCENGHRPPRDKSTIFRSGTFWPKSYIRARSEKNYQDQSNQWIVRWQPRILDSRHNICLCWSPHPDNDPWDNVKVWIKSHQSCPNGPGQRIWKQPRQKENIKTHTHSKERCIYIETKEHRADTMTIFLPPFSLKQRLNPNRKRTLLCSCQQQISHKWVCVWAPKGQ